MSISIKKFNENDFIGGRGGNTMAVYNFLLDNEDKAFTPDEILAALKEKLSTNHVGVLLQSLKNRGLVVHKSPYWAVNLSKKIKGE